MSLLPLTLLTLWVGFVVQLAVLHLPFASVRMDVGGVVLVFLGFFVPIWPGAVGVMLLGFAQEALGGSLRGVIPLAYLLIYFFQRVTHNHLFFQGGSSQMVWVMLLMILEKGLEGIFLKISGHSFPYGMASDWLFLVLSALVQGLVSLAVFPLLKKGLRLAEKYE